MSYQALLFCPDDKTARVVTQVLTELDFTVEPCNEPFAAVKKLMKQRYDALVVDCDNEQNATLLFKSARNSGSNQTSLAVAVVEGQTGVAKAFRIGANLVLTKPINIEQSKGTLRVARGLLRKADSAKPAGTPAVTIASTRPASAAFDSLRPATPKPASVSIPAHHTTPALGSAATSASAFELEPEPDTKLEPAEAAMLESMPSTVPAYSEDQSASSMLTSTVSKEYPWQPVSKPLSGPMASALKRAAEAAGKSAIDTTASIETTDSTAVLSEPAAPKESWPSAATVSASHGAAAAPAPARQPSPFKTTTVERESTEVAASAPSHMESRPQRVIVDDSFATSLHLSDTSTVENAQQQEASSAGGSKRTPLLAVAVILVAVAGYFGWTKLHPVEAPSAVQQPAAPVETPQQVPQATVVGTPAQPASTLAATPSHSSTDKGNNPQEPVAANGKSSPAKNPSAAPLEAASAKPVEGAKVRQPIVVRNGSSNTGEFTPAQEPVAAPSPESLASGSGPSRTAISGIASTIPVNVPNQPHTMKVTQGVLQGMLMTKVQPHYPEQALMRGIQGAVELQATIGRDGSITRVKPLSGDTQLAKAAMDAVRQWKYKPYLLNGEPVEIESQITVNFKRP